MNTHALTYPETQEKTGQDVLSDALVTCCAEEEGPRERFKVQEVGCHLRVRAPDSRIRALRPISHALQKGTHPTDSPGPTRREQFLVQIAPPEWGPQTGTIHSLFLEREEREAFLAPAELTPSQAPRLKEEGCSGGTSFPLETNR